MTLGRSPDLVCQVSLARHGDTAGLREEQVGRFGVALPTAGALEPPNLDIVRHEASHYPNVVQFLGNPRSWVGDRSNRRGLMS